MNIGNIINFGIYDSKFFSPQLSVSPERLVQTFEFDYVISADKGAFSYINSKSQPIFPQLLILRKPGEKSHSKLHFKCYALHFNVEESSPIYEELLNLPSYFLVTNNESYQNIFSSLFRHLIKSKENYHSYYTYSKIFELIYNLKKDAEENQKALFSPKRKEALSIKKAVTYIKKNFPKQITLADLGKVSGYSPNHFRNIFTATMNLSPQKYLEKVRIDYAKFLLVQNDLSIAEIAYACGFSSQSYFTKVFKAFTMQTPHEFLKSSLILI